MHPRFRPIRDRFGRGARSFATEVTDFDTLRAALVSYSAHCAQQLREQQSVCSEIMVFIHTNPFKEYQPQYNLTQIETFATPTDSTLEIAERTSKMLKEIFRPGCEYKYGVTGKTRKERIRGTRVTIPIGIRVTEKKRRARHE